MDKFLQSTAEDSADKEKRKKLVENLFKDSKESKLSLSEFNEFVQSNKDSDLPMVRWVFVKVPIFIEEDQDSEVFVEEEVSLGDILKKTQFVQSEVTQLFKLYDKILERTPLYLRKGRSFDRGGFLSLISPPFSDDIARLIFNSFFGGKDHITVRQFVIGLSTCCHSNPKEKLELIFQALDVDQDGKLTELELHSMIQLIWKAENLLPTSEVLPITIATETGPHSKKIKKGFQTDPVQLLVNTALKKQNQTEPVEGATDQEKTETKEELFITKDDFLNWTSSVNFGGKFFLLLKRVVCINLGPPPSTPQEESDIIQSLCINAKKKMKVGDLWYAIPTTWWDGWNKYITFHTSAGLPSRSGVGEERSGPINNAPICR